MFLTETDTKQLLTKNDYKIEGYETFLQKTVPNKNLVRIIALIKNELLDLVSCCEALMDSEFPSIWLEIKIQGCQRTLVGGFYRVWTHENKNRRSPPL